MKQSNFSQVIIDNDGHMLMKDSGPSVKLSIDLYKCLSQVQEGDDFEEYSVIFPKEDRFYYIDPLKVNENLEAGFNQTNDLWKFAAINGVDYRDVFNFDMITFSAMAVKYLSDQYNVTSDFVIGRIEIHLGYIDLYLDTYKYLWIPIPDGPKLQESDAKVNFDILCYSATFSRKAIGKSLTLADRTGRHIDNVEIDVQYQLRKEQTYFRADQFKGIFEGLKDTKDTFYIFEAVKGMLYVTRVEPLKYVTKPYQEPNFIQKAWSLIVGE
jgi:hypothetical protein